MPTLLDDKDQLPFSGAFGNQEHSLQLIIGKEWAACTYFHFSLTQLTRVVFMIQFSLIDCGRFSEGSDPKPYPKN